MRPDRDPRLDTTTRLLLAAALGLAILLASGLLLGQELPAGTRFDAGAAIERSQRVIGNTIGNYTLRDTDERPLSLASYRGKPLVISFVYTGCFQVCPTTTRFLQQAVQEAQRALGPGSFEVVTIGFNLPFDTPAAMRDFQARHGAGAPGWRFLAGDAATVDALARDVGFAWMRTASGFDHVTQATIVDGRGRIARQVYGESFELPMLVAPIRELVTGEAAPAVSLRDVLEQVRILCTVYDPRSGRYRLDYGLFIEIFAGLTILGATAWYLLAEWRRQRTARPS